MRIPPAVRSRLRVPAAALCAIVGLVVAWPDSLWPGGFGLIPHSVETAAEGPVARITSASSLYLLQTLGYFFSVHDGLLKIHDATFDLAQASGGLLTLTAVIAFSVAAAALARKPVWERVFIAASGLPIGLLCGVFRVTAGCLLLAEVNEGLGRLILIDIAGWTTLTFAVPCLLAEREVLSRLLIPPPDRDVVPVLRRAESSFTTPKPVMDSRSNLPDGKHSTITGTMGEQNSPTIFTEDSTIQQLGVVNAET